MPDLADRNALDIQNPVDCARAYEIIVRAFYTKMCCVDLTRGKDQWRSSQKKINKYLAEEGTGIFGKIAAAYSITEIQGRDALHAHAILYQHAWAEALSKFCHDKLEDNNGKKTLYGEICRMVDSHIKGSVQEGVTTLREHSENKHMRLQQEEIIAL